MITIFKDNTSPSILDTIRVNKAAFNLTGSTVQFRMRLDDPAATELKVDEPAYIANYTAGVVRYDWAAEDTDTPGDYLAWWHVNLPGEATQDTLEFPVRVEAHADPASDYITLADLKNSLQPGVSDSFAESDMLQAISAASIGVNGLCRRRFWLDPTAVDRYYTADSDTVQIDDTPVLTDNDAILVIVAGVAWTAGVDYLLEPLNAPADGRPYEQLRLLSPASAAPAAVNVRARFGWRTVPKSVKTATTMLAGKLLLRMRQAPLGFQLTAVNAIRIGSADPDINLLLAEMSRVRAMKTLRLQ